MIVRDSKDTLFEKIYRDDLPEPLQEVHSG
jgi:hypothetical protein